MIAQLVGFFCDHKHRYPSLSEQKHTAEDESGNAHEPAGNGNDLECAGERSFGYIHECGAEERAQGRSSERSEGGVKQHSRLLVLSTRIEEELVRTAGATISDSAANGLVGSFMSEL
jgi:hypothetical protein